MDGLPKTDRAPAGGRELEGGGGCRPGSELDGRRCHERLRFRPRDGRHPAVRVVRRLPQFPPGSPPPSGSPRADGQRPSPAGRRRTPTTRPWTSSMPRTSMSCSSPRGPPTEYCPPRPLHNSNAAHTPRTASPAGLRPRGRCLDRRSGCAGLPQRSRRASAATPREGRPAPPSLPRRRIR